MRRSRRLLLALTALLAWLAGWTCNALTICDICGHEAEDGATVCAHCGAPLPVAPPAEPAPEAVDDAMKGETPTGAAALARRAFEAARADVLLARDEEKRRPAVALAFYENALALIAAVSAAELPPGTGPAILAGLQHCRDALSVSDRICDACAGTGRRRIPVALLEGAPEEGAGKMLEGSICAACGGTGRLRGKSNVEATRLTIVQGRREAGLKLLAAGRVALGRAWVPDDWPATLTARQTAAVRKAVAPPCAVCAGLGVEGCRTCGGTGSITCTAPGCRQGWVEQTTRNALSPKTALKQRVRCPVCGGSGKIPCPDCHGEGRKACKACGGSGAAPVCSACGGEGIVTCTRCRGVPSPPGTPPCPACQGTGVMLCRSCHGDGCRTR